MQRLSKLTIIQISYSLVAIGVGATAFAEPLPTDTVPFRRLTVICPIHIFSGKLADDGTKPSRFIAEGPVPPTNHFPLGSISGCTFPPPLNTPDTSLPKFYNSLIYNQ
jgi:hypothetical protein